MHFVNVTLKSYLNYLLLIVIITFVSNSTFEVPDLIVDEREFGLPFDTRGDVAIAGSMVETQTIIWQCNREGHV